MWLIPLIQIIFIIFFVRQIIIAILALYGGVFYDVAYHPSNIKHLKELIRQLKLDKNAVIYELGAGDGRVSFTLADFFKFQMYAIELNYFLVYLGKIKAYLMKKNVQFIRQNLFATNLTRANLVYLYLSPAINKKLQQKLELELKKGSFVISYKFPFYSQKFRSIKNHNYFVYQKVT